METKEKGRTDLQTAGSGLEQVTDLYRRLAGAVGKDFAQKTAEGTERTAFNTEAIKNAIEDIRKTLQGLGVPFRHERDREAAGG